MKLAPLVGHHPRRRRMVDHLQLHQVGVLRLRHFVCDHQTIEAILRAKMFEFGIIVPLQAARNRAAIWLGVEDVLRAIPGVDKGAGLLEGQRDGYGRNKSAGSHAYDETDSAPLRHYFSFNPEPLHVAESYLIRDSVDGRLESVAPQRSPARIEANVLAVGGGDPDNPLFSRF